MTAQPVSNSNQVRLNAPPDAPTEVTFDGSDIGGDEVDPKSVTVTTSPINGSVKFDNGGDLVYTPNPGFSGNDQFTVFLM